MCVETTTPSPGRPAARPLRITSAQVLFVSNLLSLLLIAATAIRPPGFIDLSYIIFIWTTCWVFPVPGRV